MKTLSLYDKQTEPIVLRQDLVKDNHGVGYYGSKLKENLSTLPLCLKN